MDFNLPRGLVVQNQGITGTVSHLPSSQKGQS